MLQQPGKSNKFSPFFSKLTNHNIYSSSSNVCSSDQIVKNNQYNKATSVAARNSQYQIKSNQIYL